MARQNLSGNPEFATNLPYFILVERGQGFNDQPCLHETLNASDSIMVSFDEIGFCGSTRFYRVRIDRSLSQNPVSVEKMLCAENALLHSHELLADCTPLLFWIFYAF